LKKQTHFHFYFSAINCAARDETSRVKPLAMITSSKMQNQASLITLPRKIFCAAWNLFFPAVVAGQARLDSAARFEFLNGKRFF